MSSRRHFPGLRQNINADDNAAVNPGYRGARRGGIETRLKTYVLYVHEDRYSVPTLDSITVAGDELARAAAADRLASSAHYRAVELWEDDRLVAKLEKPAGGTAA